MDAERPSARRAHEDVPTLGRVGPRPARTSRHPLRAEWPHETQLQGHPPQRHDLSCLSPCPMAAHQLSVHPGAEGDRNQPEGRAAVLDLGNEALGDPLNQATGSFRDQPSRSSKLSLVVHLPAWTPGQHVDIL